MEFLKNFKVKLCLAILGIFILLNFFSFNKEARLYSFIKEKFNSELKQTISELQLENENYKKANDELQNKLNKIYSERKIITKEKEILVSELTKLKNDLELNKNIEIYIPKNQEENSKILNDLGFTNIIRECIK